MKRFWSIELLMIASLSLIHINQASGQLVETGIVKVSPKVICQAEESCVDKQGSWVVKRLGKTLYLRMQNGKQIKLQNNSIQGEGEASYSFSRYIPQINAFEIVRAGYEVASKMLINYANGKSVGIIDSMFEFSSDGKYISGISCDNEIFLQCTISISSVKNWAKFEKIWQCKVPLIDLAKPKWRNYRQIEIRYEDNARQTDKSIDINQTYLVSKNNDVWSSNLPCIEQ